MNCYRLRGVALIVGALLNYCTALAADEEFFGIFSQKLDSPTDPGIVSYLDVPLASDSSKPTEQSLRSLSVLGVSFSGRVKLDGGKVTAISYWVDNAKLESAAADSLFKAVASHLEQQHGPARAADVPNFEDASAGSTRVLRWQIAEEVILLSIHLRSQYANVSLERIKQTAWLADMGASESEFWKATLRRDVPQPQLKAPQTQNSVPSQSLQSPVALTPHVSSPTTGFAKTSAVPVERRAALWPWLLGSLALGAIGLVIWKRRP